MRTIAILFLFTIALICILVGVLSGTEVNPGKYEKFFLPPFVSLLVAVALVLCALFAGVKDQVSLKRFYLLLLSGNVLLLVAQILIVRSTYYFTTWDPGTILSFSEAVYEGFDTAGWAWYFNLFPNNDFLTVAMVQLTAFAHAIGKSPTLVAALVGAVLVNIGGLFSAISAQRITGSVFVSACIWVLYSILASLSPWIAVPYSDTYSIVFVAGSILCLTFVFPLNNRKRAFFIGAAFAACVLIGAQIKPTVVIVLISAGLVFVVFLFTHFTRSLLKSIVPLCFGCVASMLLCGLVLVPNVHAKMESYYQSNHDEAVSVTHYLMMGANPDTFGSFSFDDYAISRSVEGYERRQSVNLSIYKDRMQDFGCVGYVAFLGRKLLLTYYDGDFGVGGEGDDLPLTAEKVLDNPWGDFSQFLRDIYYFSGEKPHLLVEIEQVSWFAVLLLMLAFSICFAFQKELRENADPVAVICILSFLGVTVFLLLFETRSRYLYCFLPLFSVIAAFGMAYGRRVADSIRFMRSSCS